MEALRQQVQTDSSQVSAPSTSAAHARIDEVNASDHFNAKVIWITGASGGIGAALARELAARGARLILSARRIDLLRQLRDELPNSQSHHVFALDLAKPEGLYAEVQQIIADYGPIDILINNAGVAQRALVEDTEFAVDRHIMEVNFFGTVAMTKAVLPSMLARGAGQIMTVSSVAGKVGSQTRSCYSASKHALQGYMDSLRAEVWHRGVRVQLACPGWVNTDIGKNALDGRGNTNDSATIDFGISAESCAAKIVKAIAKQREEIVIGTPLLKMAPALKALFPNLVSRLMRRQVFR